MALLLLEVAAQLLLLEAAGVLLPAPQGLLQKGGTM
jgi:hypothetical protein